jgi:histidyl-tRNA synthetase
MTTVQSSLRCPGMHDLGPEEMNLFRRVESAFSQTCDRWGYQEIRTPVLEYLHLFTSAGTLSPQMLGRVYSFLDWDGWSGERVVLRPDGTIPAARLYWERLRGQVAKLYYIENLFRFAGAEERREVWQCGAELIGDTWPFGDLEAIALVRDVLARLGIKQLGLRLSHTGITRSVLAAARSSPEEQLALYDRLMEGDPAVFDEISLALPGVGAPTTMLRDLTGGHVHGLDNLKAAFGAAIPGIVGPIDELRTVAAALEAAGYPYELDLTIVRGFEYYTGPVFQVVVDGENIAGGGRYDDLIVSQEGQSTPACGFAIYVEPLLERLSGEPVPAEAPIEIGLAESSAEELAAALRLASELHDRGLRAGLVPSRGASARWRIETTNDGLKRGYRVLDRTGGGAFEAADADAIALRLDGAQA